MFTTFVVSQNWLLGRGYSAQAIASIGVAGSVSAKHGKVALCEQTGRMALVLLTCDQRRRANGGDRIAQGDLTVNEHISKDIRPAFPQTLAQDQIQTKLLALLGLEDIPDEIEYEIEWEREEEASD